LVFAVRTARNGAKSPSSARERARGRDADSSRGSREGRAMNHGRAIYAATNDNAPAPFQISYIIRTHLRFRARSRARRFARIVFAYRFAFIDVTSYPGLSVLYCIKYIVIYIYIYIYIYSRAVEIRACNKYRRVRGSEVRRDETHDSPSIPPSDHSPPIDPSDVSAH